MTRLNFEQLSPVNVCTTCSAVWHHEGCGSSGEKREKQFYDDGLGQALNSLDYS